MTMLPQVLFEGIFVLSVVGFYLAFKIGYKPAVLEKHRLTLFNYRSELYDLLRQGQIDPNHPAYRHVEKHINNLLRYSHTTTTIRIIATMVILKMGWYAASKDKEYLDGVASMPKAEELDDKIVKELLRIKRGSFREVVKFLPKYSPAWHIVVIVGSVFRFFRFISKDLSRNEFEARVISKDYDLENYNEDRSMKLAKYA